MAEGFTSLIYSVAGLMLAGGTADRTNPHQALVSATRALIQTAEATAAHAQRMPLLESTHTRGGEVITQLSSLRRRANALANITATFSDAADRYVVAYITSLAGRGTELMHFLDPRLAEGCCDGGGQANRGSDDRRGWNCQSLVWHRGTE